MSPAFEMTPSILTLLGPHPTSPKLRPIQQPPIGWCSAFAPHAKRLAGAMPSPAIFGGVLKSMAAIVACVVSAHRSRGRREPILQFVRTPRIAKRHVRGQIQARIPADGKLRLPPARGTKPFLSNWDMKTPTPSKQCGRSVLSHEGLIAHVEATSFLQNGRAEGGLLKFLGREQRIAMD